MPLLLLLLLSLLLSPFVVGVGVVEQQYVGKVDKSKKKYKSK
jgi:hypothetical protein